MAERKEMEPTNEVYSQACETVNVSVVLARLVESSRVTVEELGLVFQQDIAEGELWRVEQQLTGIALRATLQLNFMRGDLYNAIPGGYGAKVDTIRASYGTAYYKHMKTCGWVANRWPLARRRMGLPWTFYKLTAKYAEAKQDEWMNRWTAENWNITRLQQELHKQPSPESKSVYYATRLRATFIDYDEFLQFVKNMAHLPDGM